MQINSVTTFCNTFCNSLSMLKIHLIVCSSKGWGFGNVTEVGVRWKHWFLGTSNQIYASSSLQRKSSESWKLAGFHSSDNIKRGVNKDLQGLHHSISNRVQKWKSKHRIFSFRETWYHNWFFSRTFKKPGKRKAKIYYCHCHCENTLWVIQSDSVLLRLPLRSS